MRGGMLCAEGLWCRTKQGAVVQIMTSSVATGRLFRHETERGGTSAARATSNLARKKKKAAFNIGAGETAEWWSCGLPGYARSLHCAYHYFQQRFITVWSRLVT